MNSNPFLHRTNQRAKSEMLIRNTYSKNYGIQYYLIVEGTSDEKFFENVLDCKTCKVVSLGDKNSVKEFIKEKNNRREKGYLGIVDADFDHILKNEDGIDNIILTDQHDIEMVMFYSKPNCRRIYSELSANIVIHQYEKTYHQTFLDGIIQAAYRVGLLKLVLGRPKYRINMRDLPYVDFISNSFEVDIRTLIERVIDKRFSLNEIEQEWKKELDKEHDLYQVACGHDVTSIMAICFTSKENEGIGYGNNRFVKRENIEELLRVVYDYNSFSKTKMYQSIIEWQRNNVVILDKEYQVLME